VKLGLQNYAVIEATNYNNYITFNNKNMNSLQIGLYGTAKNYSIIHKVLKRMAQHKLKFQNTAIFKSSFKENFDSNKACKYVHEFSMHKTSSVEVQWFISLHEF
jgi:hypothetical protein